MAQAKSVEKPDDFSHVKRNLEASLRTLNAASKITDVEQLVFVTNSPNPFNNIRTMHKFSSPLNMAPFSELPTSCQKSITDICSKNGYSIDTSMLTVCVMQFHGESEDERYKVLQSLTMEFLNDLDFIIIGALPGHLPLFAIVPQGPERDTGGTGAAKIASEVPI